jgi:hypothetical protein
MISAKRVQMDTAFSIRDNLDPDSKVTEESDLHSEKHPLPKFSTDEGRMISTNTVSMNAQPSIRDNRDPDSNVTDQSDWHS